MQCEVKSGSGSEVESQRHNDDLRRRVQLFLERSNLPALRRIEVDVDGDCVVLRGQVQTFYERQLASEFSRRVAGVIEIADHITVHGYAAAPSPPGSLQSRRQRLEPAYSR